MMRLHRRRSIPPPTFAQTSQLVKETLPKLLYQLTDQQRRTLKHNFSAPMSFETLCSGTDEVVWILQDTTAVSLTYCLLETAGDLP